MKKILLSVLVVAAIASCKKETYTKTNSYVNLVYEIDNTEDSLHIVFRRAVYNDSVAGNIDFDTLITTDGTHYIPVQVLIGEPVMLYGLSNLGPGFHLRIKGEDGTVIRETDTVTYYPANLLARDRWVSKLEMIP